MENSKLDGIKDYNRKSNDVKDKKKFIIIGGGLMGILTSYYLSDNPDNKIIVLEKESEVSEGASYANAGLLCPTLSYSIASPKLYGFLLYNVIRGKVGVNQWFSKDFLKWFYILSKMSLKNEAKNKTIIHHRLCKYSLQCLQNIIDKEGLKEKTSLKSGLITTYKSSVNFEISKQNIELFSQQLKYPYTILTKEQTEKKLKPFVFENLLGSIYSPIDRVGDSRNFALQLKIKCIQKGVEFVHNTTVSGFKHTKNKVISVNTNNGNFKGDNFIICAGVYTPILSKLLGVYVPIIPMKGYSISYHYDKLPELPICDSKSNTPYTIQDTKNSVGIIQFDKSIRIAGVGDFFGFDYTISKKRSDFLHSVFNTYFPEKTYKGFSTWTGLRPLTPDSLPIVGKLFPFKNVYVNAGHGMFGWTMCAGSSKILTDKIEGRLPKILPHWFSLNRF